ncbi:AfsR/SARP family transcriptional regulator [Phycicoccus flavus]|uniref:AfsR/SARP family transcriptional regulator n=1 Tax=Phycicoccus flavus TaxID=2502783 RepID=UPI000FEB87D9|nr:BTAD domain-containing putative transcriptional regulator [Phycicoccus flavus]NHA69606.1 hypothetical protein [Phycicoccus flavus]
MRVGVLGPTEVCGTAGTVDLGPRMHRALVAALALHHGEVVSVDAIVDLLWRDRPPRTAVGTLQAYVAGVRRALAASAPAEPVLLTRGAGYVLDLPAGALDVEVLTAAVARASAALAPVLADPVRVLDRPPTADAVGADELALWRGEPYADLGDHPDVVAERARLTEVRTTAEELRAAAHATGADPTAALGALDRLTRLHPLRERLWALRAVALARAGRQAEALAALREVRARLADELGIDPGEQLREVEQAVLRQRLGPASAPPPTLPEPSAPPPTAPERTGAAAAPPGTFGPVDAFLALAAATTGEHDLATRHVGDAEELCREWRIPRVTRWLREARDRHGF